MIALDRIEPIVTTATEERKDQTPEWLAEQLAKETDGGNTARLRDLQYPKQWVLVVTESDDLLAKAQEALGKAGKFGVMFANW